MKRVLRELFRGQQGCIKSFDLIVRVQKTFDSADFPAVEKEFIELLTKLHCQAEQEATKHQTNSELK
jgi:ribonuclease P protein component